MSGSIIATAAKQVTTMLASAIVLVAVGEAAQWFCMWRQERK